MRWHETQSLESPEYTPPVWQSVQDRPAWALVSAKREVWMKFAPVQPAVLWHWLQEVLKPAAAWLGAVVRW